MTGLMEKLALALNEGGRLQRDSDAYIAIDHQSFEHDSIRRSEQELNGRARRVENATSSVSLGSITAYFELYQYFILRKVTMKYSGNAHNHATGPE